MKKKIDKFDAEHPARKLAISMIENVIEPLLGKGLNGLKYYEYEDMLVKLIMSYYPEK